jgi:hypothetical protein
MRRGVAPPLSLPRSQDGWGLALSDPPLRGAISACRRRRPPLPTRCPRDARGGHLGAPETLQDTGGSEKAGRGEGGEAGSGMGMRFLTDTCSVVLGSLVIPGNGKS